MFRCCSLLNVTTIFRADKPAFSIHDSFLVIKEDIEVIKEMMQRHFYEALGFKPVIRVEK